MIHFNCINLLIYKIRCVLEKIKYKLKKMKGFLCLNKKFLNYVRIISAH